MKPIASGRSSLAAVCAAIGQRPRICGDLSLLQKRLQTVQTPFEFTRKAHDIDKRGTQVVCDYIREALHLVIRLHKVASSPTNAPFEVQVQGTHLVPSRAEVARVTGNCHCGRTYDCHDDDAAHDREPAEPSRIPTMLGHACGQPRIGSTYGSREQHIGFVHQRLAAVRSEYCCCLLVLSIALQFDGLIHLNDFVTNDRGQPIDQGGKLGVRGEIPLELLELPLSEGLGRIVRSEIDLISGHEKAALARFCCLQRVAEFCCNASCIACGDDVIEIDLGAHTQPVCHPDDAHQRNKADEQKHGGGLDEKAARDIHESETTVEGILAAPA